MPYASVSDVPSYVPEDKKKQWLEVWNSAHAAAKKKGESDKDAEASAFAQANGVTQKKESKSMSTPKTERRFIVATEVRAAQEGDKKVLEGYAAKYDTLSEDLGGFREVIKPSAFTRSIKDKADVVGLVDHNPNAMWGRSGKNMELKSDKTGLHFRAQLPDTQVANDLWENVRSGLMEKCSFGFIAQRESWTDTKRGGYADVQYQGVEDKQAIVRELHDVDLRDVSVVVNPAYPDTGVKARSGAMTQVEIRSLFPDGIPDEVAKHMAAALEARAVKHLVTEADGTEHLPYTGDDGKPDHHLMGAAWAALHGGYRGNKYEGPGKSEAISKLKGVYKSEGMDTPAESKSLKLRVEKRADDESMEETIREISKALDAKYPYDQADGGCCSGKYYVCETYPDYVIVSEWKTGEYFQIAYAEGLNDDFTFGEPMEVEKEWVPATDEGEAERKRRAQAFDIATRL